MKRQVRYYAKMGKHALSGETRNAFLVRLGEQFNNSAWILRRRPNGT